MQEILPAQIEVQVHDPSAIVEECHVLETTPQRKRYQVVSFGLDTTILYKCVQADENPAVRIITRHSEGQPIADIFKSFSSNTVCCC